MSFPANATESRDGTGPDWQALVREQVASLRFGVVEIVVHESRLVQIEKTERVRLDKKEYETRP